MADLVSWGDTLLRRSPAQPLCLWRASRKLAVLAYHGVDEPERFESHMRILRQEWHPVSVEEVLEAMAGGPGLPRRAVLVTFDDGQPSHLETAAPILKRLGIPAAVFVVAGLLDGNQPFWWDEVRDLTRQGGTSRALEGLSVPQRIGKIKQLADSQRRTILEELRATAKGQAPVFEHLRRIDLHRLETAGLEVGSHTLTHPCLPRCSLETMEHEIEEAHRILHEALGHPPRSFAYPNGDADPRAHEVLARYGYRLAFLFDHRLAAAPPTKPLEISRLRVGNSSSTNRLRLILSGLHPLILRMAGRIR